MRVPCPPPAHCLSVSPPSASYCTAEDDVATTWEARGAAHPCVATASSLAASPRTRLAGLADISRITPAKQREFVPLHLPSRLDPRVRRIVSFQEPRSIENRPALDFWGLCCRIPLLDYAIYLSERPSHFDIR